MGRKDETVRHPPEVPLTGLESGRGEEKGGMEWQCTVGSGLEIVGVPIPNPPD